MVHHWQSHNVKLSGVDDMVLLPKVTEEAIVDNLRKRYMDDYIFTRIGPVLVSVNPFKQMPYFGEKEIDQYQGAAAYENPPHVYGLADEMYRNLLIDGESQCVIISGESGAGKTVAAKYIMSYIAKVSGGSTRVQHVKDVIIESNPLLEAFGNAKTVRNNNSSRFGKYVEIVFGKGGQPQGGKVSSFLLEKSRICNLSSGERNFHIFYQLCCGADETLQKDMGLAALDHYLYLAPGHPHTAQGINDAKDFQETVNALRIMNVSKEDQKNIWMIVAAVMHLGNITFEENGNYSKVYDSSSLAWPAYLLGVEASDLETKLTSRRFDSKWGAQADSIDVTLNPEQAAYSRNALAKGIYARLFDYLIQRVNQAMRTDVHGETIGILDIYGFEILDTNGFEQFCINFVNEKLQQIFIQLTLKAEQEEYVTEGIEWSPISYFNNAVVCELLEGRRPPGMFLILDDVCATLHAGTAGADADLLKKLDSGAGRHEHYQHTSQGFTIRHYAGTVTYSVDGFCDRNRDVLFPDLIQLLQSGSSAFLRTLFPDEINGTAKTRPTTAGSKIRNQANELVTRLMKCSPHYIRCIKPNEKKAARDFNELRVKHQVEYLGLSENIRVRRAGYAYRRPFERFLHRYLILATNKPSTGWHGDPRAGVKKVLRTAGLDDKQYYQLGKTKVFIKAPETLFLLEEIREQHYNKHAIVIQKAFKRHFARKRMDEQRQEAADLVFGRKERRRFSVNRYFVGDYIGIENRPALLAVIGRRERINFAQTVVKYDRRFRPSNRDLIVTSRSLLLINMECGPGRGKDAPLEPVIKRNIPFPNISHVLLSTLQDDFIIIYVKDDFASLLEITFKTEFLNVLAKKYKSQTAQPLTVIFSNSAEFTVKKSGLVGGGTRSIHFVPSIENKNRGTLRANGYSLSVTIGRGLPADTTPMGNRQPVYGTGATFRQHIAPAPSRAAPLPPGVITLRPLSSTQETLRPASIPPKYQSLSPAPIPTKFQLPPAASFSQPKTKSPVSPAVSPQVRAQEHQAPNGPLPPLPKRPQNWSSKTSPVTVSSGVGETTLQTDALAGVLRSSTGLRDNNVDKATFDRPKLKDSKPAQESDFNQELFNTIRRVRKKIAADDEPSSDFVNGHHENGHHKIIPNQINNMEVSNQTRNGPSRPVPGGGRPKPAVAVKPIINKVKALYNYEAQANDELTFKEGDIMQLIEEHDGGWWSGKLRGREGLFPANHVEKIK